MAEAEKREGEEDPDEEPKQRGRGRLQTTGLYAGRAKALEELNLQKKKEEELDDMKALRNMSAGEIFYSMERNIEAALESMEEAPAAALAQQVKESMAEVIRVAKGSKNLKGGFVKLLKQAAVVGTASAEVFRTRVDCGTADGETLLQMRAIKTELDHTKAEAQSAREEAEKARKEAAKLREELAAAKALLEMEEMRRRGEIRDDGDPPARPSNRAQTRSEAVEEASYRASIAETHLEPMEVEVDEAGARTIEEPEYDDERRRREILPPPEDWPPAYRPELRGQVKILEDHPTRGVTVGLAVKKKKKGKKPATRGSPDRGETGGIRYIMERITPMLETWLRQNMPSQTPAGVSGGSGRGGGRHTPPEKNARKAEERGRNPAPPGRPRLRSPVRLGGGEHMLQQSQIRNCLARRQRERGEEWTPRQQTRGHRTPRENGRR